LITSFFTMYFPWFVYPVAVLAMTVSFHFYLFVRPKEWFQLHCAYYLILNAMLFITWLFTKADDDSHDFAPWFVFPLFGLGVLLSIHYAAKKYHKSAHRWFYIHSSFFWSVNALCLFIWFYGAGFPWWIIVFFSLALPYVIHWSLHYYPGDGFKLHAVIFADLQLLLFFIWAMLPPYVFPFFVFPLFIWGAGLGMHYFLKRKKEITSSSPSSTVASSPGDLEANNNEHRELNSGVPTGYLYPTLNIPPAANTNPFEGQHVAINNSSVGKVEPKS